MEDQTAGVKSWESVSALAEAGLFHQQKRSVAGESSPMGILVLRGRYHSEVKFFFCFFVKWICLIVGDSAGEVPDAAVLRKRNYFKYTLKFKADVMNVNVSKGGFSLAYFKM